MIRKSIFEIVLGDQWDDLCDVIKRHYSLKPFSDDYVCVRGEMSEVYHSAAAKLLIPFAILFGAVVPFRGSNVPIEVHYNSNTRNGNLYWDRIFKFSDKNHFHFKSHMEHIQGNEVVEFVRLGVGMRLKVTAEEGAIIFRDNGYIWRLLGVTIPIPVNLVLGSAYVEERSIDDSTFSMKMIIKHPLFGVMFRYAGKFKLDR
ncbi:MAG: DUF4166 domain-containing protein [Pseudomonadales bacterium]|nr:DUF4166 domain-containing protein [Pseudomonadales bacterium]